MLCCKNATSSSLQYTPGCFASYAFASYVFVSLCVRSMCIHSCVYIHVYTFMCTCGLRILCVCACILCACIPCIRILRVYPCVSVPCVCIPMYMYPMHPVCVCVCVCVCALLPLCLPLQGALHPVCVHTVATVPITLIAVHHSCSKSQNNTKPSCVYKASKFSAV